jgi:hypothetical protein
MALLHLREKAVAVVEMVKKIAEESQDSQTFNAEMNTISMSPRNSNFGTVDTSIANI